MNELIIKWAIEFCVLMQLESAEKNLTTAYMIISASLEHATEDQSEMDLLLRYSEASLLVDESFAIDRYHCKNGDDYEAWQRNHRRLRMVKWWAGALLTKKRMEIKHPPLKEMDFEDDDGDYAAPLHRLQEMLGIVDERIANG